ncbi:DNA adenine methylase [Paraburkholderia fungorum]|uniref:DNA adenine methylase n=1 Tax=Paraburkholderia fungorum TaxID=134537 RepID=UPI00402BA293
MRQKNSFLAWVGGKSHLTDRIIPLLPDHHCYCEVFAGAAWMMFRKEESRVEVINDINTDLVTLYRVVKHHLEEFARTLKWLLVARDEFERFLATDPATLTDIQRAARFYYLMKTGYGARLRSPSFGIATTAPSRFNLLRIEEELSAAHLRLPRVYVENRPFQDVIERFDRPDTLFYVDPPYWGCEDYYGKGVFSREDFVLLRDRLAAIKGRFVMSINDTPEIRGLFGSFTLRKVPTRYSLAKTGNQAVTELLVLNYKPGKKG